MIAYSPAKINIGIKILDKRKDGFHNLHSYFYPIPLYDLIETRESDEDELLQTGFISTSEMKDNLVYKALCLLRNNFEIPPLKIHLHKQIPFQAGLGGGSGNAMTIIKLLSDQYHLKVSEDLWQYFAENLGSDCPFFIHSKAAEVEGRGELVKHIGWSLKGVYIVIVKADVAVSTKLAFKNIIPQNQRLNSIMDVPFTDYQKAFSNQFETSIFQEYPQIEHIKEKLIQSGAFYASLSGTGAAVFGLFKNDVKISFPASYFVWKGLLQ